MTTLDLLVHLARSIPQGIANLTGSPTLSGGLWTALLISLPMLAALAFTPAPRGPLHECACGRTDRLRGRESRRMFEARMALHRDRCPAIVRQP